MLNSRTIGNKIAEARKKLNISQAQLAQSLFISSQAVGKWERGESMPDIVTFNRLAEILQVDLNYFSDGFPSTEKSETIFTAFPPAAQTVAPPEKKPVWDMSGGSWVDADFSGLKNLHEKFSGSNLQRCKFIGSDMRGLLLKGNMIEGCDFSGSDMNGSQLEKSYVTHDKFTDCSLRDAKFTSSHFKDCDFTGSDLSGAEFDHSSVHKSSMAGAIVQGTVFRESDFSEVIFEGTVEDGYFDNCAFSKVTFQNTRLINTFFKCSTRSLKHLKFVNCQADRLTMEMLKSGKADLSGITLIPS
ncbi:pentapeptide repeat-containing protein [Chitinophaga sp. NPDC101104]|uniref:pentapeptide repeat-containing protein n=1 Tax=Chitinophaga sp. NPDC101104 TaxID=3390561 RepID=UPI003CFD5917